MLDIKYISEYNRLNIHDAFPYRARSMSRVSFSNIEVDWR